MASLIDGMDFGLEIPVHVLRAGDGINHRMVGKLPADGEAGGPQRGQDTVIIRRRWREARGELRRCQEVMVFGGT